VTEAVLDPNHDIVGQVFSEARISGRVIKGEKGNELNQTDIENRGRALPRERGDRLLRHRLRPSKLIVSGNTAATASNILGSERLFPPRQSFPKLICAAEFIYLALGSYRLLSGVNKTHAALMVIWGLAFVPVMAVNVLSEIAALTLLRGADFLSLFEQPHREALAMLFLDLHRYGYVVGWIFGPGFSTSGLLYIDRVSSPASWASS